MMVHPFQIRFSKTTSVQIDFTVLKHYVHLVEQLLVGQNLLGLNLLPILLLFSTQCTPQEFLALLISALIKLVLCSGIFKPLDNLMTGLIHLVFLWIPIIIPPTRQLMNFAVLGAILHQQMGQLQILLFLQLINLEMTAFNKHSIHRYVVINAIWQSLSYLSDIGLWTVKLMAWWFWINFKACDSSKFWLVLTFYAVLPLIVCYQKTGYKEKKSRK